MAIIQATPSSATTHADRLLQQAVKDVEEASCLFDLVADRIVPILRKDHAGDGAALRAAVRAMTNAVESLLQARMQASAGATAAG